MTTKTTTDDLAREMEALDPASIAFRDASDLRAIVAAETALAQAHDALDAAVIAARSRKVPWTAIGAALGITRQGARQRFGKAVAESGV